MDRSWITTLGQTTADVPQPDALVGTLVWLVIAVVVAGVLGAIGVFRPGTLRRGPTRELDLSVADLTIGLLLVSMIYVDKTLVDVGGQWIDWSERAVLIIRQVSAVGMIAAAVFFVAKAWMSEAGFRRSGLVPRRPVRDLGFGVAGLVVGAAWTFATLLVVNYVATALGHPSPTVNHGMLTQLQESESFREVAGIIVFTVLIGPILEELIFRGLVQTWLLEVLGRNARGAVVCTAAVVFSVVHVGAVSWHALPGLFVLGLVLGWLYERTGSLMPSILVHIGFNAINVSVVLVTR